MTNNTLPKSKLLALGGTTLGALLLFILLLFSIRPYVGDGKKLIHVRFDEVDKIRSGTRVNFAGKPVGIVASIRLVSRTTNTLSARYPYEATLKLDSSVELFPHDEVSIQTTGLLGERVVYITPKPHPEVPKADVRHSTLFFAKNHKGLDTMAEQATITAQQLEKSFKYLQQFVLSNEEDFQKTLRSITALGKEGDTLLQKINQSSIISSTDKLTHEVHVLLATLNRALMHIPPERLFAKLTSVLQHLDSITQALDQPQQWQKILTSMQATFSQSDLFFQQNNHHLAALLQKWIQTGNTAHLCGQKIEKLLDTTLEGRGTVGRLLGEDGIYVELQSLFQKVNLLLHDINHYGLLFHNSRQWKRVRQRAAATKEDLTSQNAVLAYWQEQIASIHTTLSRLEALKDTKGRDDQATLSPQQIEQLKQTLQKLQARVKYQYTLLTS